MRLARLGACCSAFALLLSASNAAGAENLAYGGIPAWVKPAALPTAPPRADDVPAALRYLLYDVQVSSQPEGLATYTAYARRVEAAAGLNNIIPVVISWDPALETVTLHHVRIRRGEAIIDLVKAGKAVSVLRRETNLEERTLDGILSATIQPEGLQVGDIVEVAFTSVEHDPTLQGHVQTIASPSLRDVKVVNFRAVLPRGGKLNWRAADLPGELKQSGGELLLHVEDPARIEAPRDAPGRFQMGPRVELSDFSSWKEVSALFHPLYVKARTLRPDSLLKAEIDKIKATSADPVVQASAALALVEDKVRYFAVTLDNGGYVPAQADDTWARRYGDCKAKTALLLALLDGLGIEAQPALVSSENGDGLDRRLPMPAAFDHIIVRASIGGRVYWLDGTRSGDKSIANLSNPDFVWALPFSAGGEGLRAIPPTIPARPTVQASETYDLSAGVNLFASTRVEMVIRGEAARIYAVSTGSASAAQREETAKASIAKAYPRLKIRAVTLTTDPASGDVTVVADGQTLINWGQRGVTQRAVAFPNANLAVAESFDHYPEARTLAPKPPKAPIRQENAPFAVAFPSYVASETRVILPKGAAGFSLIGANIDRTVGGKALHREARLADGVVTVRTSIRTVVSEITAEEAKAAKLVLTQIAADRVAIVAPEALFSAQRRYDEAVAQTSVTKEDYLLRAVILDERRLYADALAATGKAIELGDDSWGVYLQRGRLLQVLRRFPEAAAAYDSALSRPNIPAATAAVVRQEQVRLDSLQGHYKAALAKLDPLIEARPNDADLLLLRGQTRRAADQEDGALADFDGAIAAAPSQLDPYVNKARLLASQSKIEAAADAIVAMTAANPLNGEAYLEAAAGYSSLGRQEEARAAADRSLILKPSADGYLYRARYRPRSEAAQSLADVKAALALDTSVRSLSLAAGVQMFLHDYSGAVVNLTAAAKLSDDSTTAANLIAAYEAAGQAEQAAKAYAVLRAKSAKDASALNGLCWAQATANVALTRALSDCDAAIALKKEAAYYDSRGMVLLRLGRNADAVAAYDRSLDMQPKQTASIYGRGLARLAMGAVAKGHADLQGARALGPGVTWQFENYGLPPPPGAAP
jgi:tetratricopeptide (TPR) repeat protein